MIRTNPLGQTTASAGEAYDDDAGKRGLAPVGR